MGRLAKQGNELGAAPCPLRKTLFPKRKALPITPGS
jgi:hypothetical protein